VSPRARHGHLPRKSSPDGMAARLAARLAAFQQEVPKGGGGTQRHNRPGSLNPRKSR
jgi:hypothetical protein